MLLFLCLGIYSEPLCCYMRLSNYNVMIEYEGDEILQNVKRQHHIAFRAEYTFFVIYGKILCVSTHLNKEILAKSYCIT